MSAEVDRLQYDALTRQLERMRAMQYAYHRKFFTLLLLSSAGLAWALWNGSPAALTLLLFGLVTTGVTASFFLHFCDFARVHAAALERRINRLLGGRLLMAGELEADYFYPPASPRISGFSLAAPRSFFSVFTLHFCILWGGVSLYALGQILRYHTGAYGWVLPAYVVWLGVNVAYLIHWFVPARAERRMMATLEAGLGEGAPLR